MQNKKYSLIISGICFILFLLTLIFPKAMISYFALNSSQIEKYPWMLVTHIFLHNDFQHLFYNLIAILFFGTKLEKIIGSRLFLFFFFVSGIISGIGALSYNLSLGASGAIFGIIGILTLLRPKMVVYSFGVPMNIVMAAFMWGIFDLLGLFAVDHIAHLSHLIGLVFGVITGGLLRKKYSKESEEEQKKNPVNLNEERLQKWEKKYLK